MGFPRFKFFQIVIRAQKSRPKSWSMPRKPSLFRGTREALFFSSQLPGVDVKKRWLVGGLSTHLGMEQIPTITIVMTGGWFMIVLPTVSRFIAGWWFGTFFHILGMSSSQLTKSIIFQRGRSTTNQMMSNWCLPCFLFGTNPQQFGGQEAKRQELPVSGGTLCHQTGSVTCSARCSELIHGALSWEIL